MVGCLPRFARAKPQAGGVLRFTSAVGGVPPTPLRCSVSRPVAETHSAPFVRYVQTVGDKSVLDARCARGPRALRSSAPKRRCAHLPPAALLAALMPRAESAPTTRCWSLEPTHGRPKFPQSPQERTKYVVGLGVLSTGLSGIDCSLLPVVLSLPRRSSLANTPLLLAGNPILVAVHLHPRAVGEEILCFGTGLHL